MEKKVKEWHGIVTYQSQRWCCIQDAGNGRHWFFEPSLSYTRSQSIKLLTEGQSSTWRQLKEKYGWRCSKIFVTLNEF